MKQQSIQHLHNGNQVIMFTDKNTAKVMEGKQDLPSLYSWYKEDPMKNHLGLMGMWNQKTIRTSGFFDKLLENRAVLEVNGWDGSFTYDIPVEEVKGCYTTKDMSNQNRAGIDGDKFKIVLNKAFTVGDILTYDVFNGQDIIVVDDEPVMAVAEGFEHTVQLVTNDKNEWFLESNLAKGIEYFKIDHAIDGERGTHFSNFQFPDQVGTMRCEFKLGHMRGVESYITGKADSKSFSGADTQSKDFLNKLTAEFGNNQLAVLGDLKVNAAGKKVPNLNALKSVGATMEVLTMIELQKLTNSGLIWNKGGTIQNTHGVTKLSEGLWHQMKRGKIIKYAKPGGLEKQHLINAGNYIYRGNPDLPYFERRLVFDCGHEVFQNILRIFKEEINLQNAFIAANGMLGSDRMIPNPVGNTNDPMNLSYGTIRFTKVFIEGLGHLEIRHEPALDRMDQGVDRLHKGMHPNGYSHTTYSVIITDTASQQYSNNEELPKGTKLVEDGDNGSNVYIVKPEGEMTFWGTTNGRYDYRKSSDVQSSLKTISQEFWAFNIVSSWIKNPERVLMIELTEAAIKGYK